MDEVSRRVHKAAKDACSNDDLAGDGMSSMMWDEHDMLVPIDEQTLDERAAGVWESRRRDED